MTTSDLESMFGSMPPADEGEGGGRPGDRVPPQDLGAEQSVLGGMLLSKDAIADVARRCVGATSTSRRTS
ncbi:DnaB helicase-like protein [Marihabitans asiaticum]|uniref:DnaB helicase-like protein n=1 Tax=Marihabitans asiaticum TaxID=415218 RepID=A0A560WEL1_9MICO|nr:DnaB helicase-like protein [Marihabitans asiaticum]